MYREVNFKFSDVIAIESNLPVDDDITKIHLKNGLVLEVYTHSFLLFLNDNGMEYIGEFLEDYDTEKHGNGITIINSMSIDDCSHTSAYDYLVYDEKLENVTGFIKSKAPSSKSEPKKKYF